MHMCNGKDHSTQGWVIWILLMNFMKLSSKTGSKKGLDILKFKRVMNHSEIPSEHFNLACFKNSFSQWVKSKHWHQND